MAPMNKTTATSTKTLPLLHLLNQSRASAVRFEKDLLHLAAKNGSTVETVEATEIREVQLRKLPLLNRLTVLTKQGRTITVNGLDRNSSQALHTTLWARVDELLNEEAAAKARALTPEIASLQETITSLLTHEQVRTRDSMRPQCPACGRGSLVPSQTGDNLRCSNFPRCQQLNPRCPSCNKGYISLRVEKTESECSNPACEAPPRICPSCRQGILVIRKGRSAFWSCSRYMANPSCTHTERGPGGTGTRPSAGSRPTGQGRRPKPRYRSRT